MKLEIDSTEIAALGPVLGAAVNALLTGEKSPANQLLERMTQMSEATDRLLLEVQQTKDAIAAKISDLTAQIRANAADEAAVLSAADQLDALQAELAPAAAPISGETGMIDEVSAAADAAVAGENA